MTPYPRRRTPRKAPVQHREPEIAILDQNTMVIRFVDKGLYQNVLAYLQGRKVEFYGEPLVRV